MQTIYTNIRIKVSESVYLKDPELSDIGKKIIASGIELICNLGYELFTFKKLAQSIETTEATIYRYFESKHQLLAYLTHWYWGWQEYRLLISLTNVRSPENRLKRAIQVFSDLEKTPEIEAFNTQNLRQLVIVEANKLYHHKEVDTENEAGYFLPYKRIVIQLSQIVLEINPNYRYPHMLISTVLEGINHQLFFSQHLPRLTDVIAGEDAITNFYEEMVVKLIAPNQK